MSQRSAGQSATLRALEVRGEGQVAPVSKVDVVTASGFHVLSRLALSSRGKLCSLISVLSNTVTSGAVLSWQTLFTDLCPFEHCHVWRCPPVPKSVLWSLSFRTLSRLALSSRGKLCSLISVLSNTVMSGAVLPWQTLFSDLCPFEHCHVWCCPPVANSVL